MLLKDEFIAKGYCVSIKTLSHLSRNVNPSNIDLPINRFCLEYACRELSRLLCQHVLFITDIIQSIRRARQTTRSAWNVGLHNIIYLVVTCCRVEGNKDQCNQCLFGRICNIPI